VPVVPAAGIAGIIVGVVFSGMILIFTGMPAPISLAYRAFWDDQILISRPACFNALFQNLTTIRPSTLPALRSAKTPLIIAVRRGNGVEQTCAHRQM
jgi:hypothetical protein